MRHSAFNDRTLDSRLLNTRATVMFQDWLSNFRSGSAMRTVRRAATAKRFPKPRRLRTEWSPKQADTLEARTLLSGAPSTFQFDASQVQGGPADIYAAANSATNDYGAAATAAYQAETQAQYNYNGYARGGLKTSSR